jgi:hypothetical protein
MIDSQHGILLDTNVVVLSRHISFSYTLLCFGFFEDSDHFNNDACIDGALEDAGIEQSTMNTCMNISDETYRNILQDELEMQKEMGIFMSPTVLINSERTVLWDGLTPGSVLKALCDTFEYGEKPHVCYACMNCGDPVACARRSPMICQADDGKEKEDPNAHKDHSATGGKKKKKSHWGRWFFGLILVGGCIGAFIHYKKQQERGDGYGSYTLQDAFLSDSN